jgi:hypothetical protein
LLRFTRKKRRPPALTPKRKKRKKRKRSTRTRRWKMRRKLFRH